MAEVAAQVAIAYKIKLEELTERAEKAEAERDANRTRASDRDRLQRRFIAFCDAAGVSDDDTSFHELRLLRKFKNQPELQLMRDLHNVEMRKARLEFEIIQAKEANTAERAAWEKLFESEAWDKARLRDHIKTADPKLCDELRQHKERWCGDSKISETRLSSVRVIIESHLAESRGAQDDYVGFWSPGAIMHELIEAIERILNVSAVPIAKTNAIAVLLATRKKHLPGGIEHDYVNDFRAHRLIAHLESVLLPPHCGPQGPI